MPKLLPAIVLILLTASGCLTPKKVDRWIDRKYEPAIVNKPRQSDYITINWPKSSLPADVLAKTEKRKMKLLPALFFWKWEYGTSSELSENVPGWYLNSAIIPYANSKGLKQKLNGQKLELTIEKMPGSFSVVDKGGLVFLVIWYVSWDKIFMDPQKQELVISYRLLKDGVETKKGTVTAADRNQPMTVKVFRSVKKTFWEYLDQYGTNLQAMGKSAVDKIVQEL